MSAIQEKIREERIAGYVTEVGKEHMLDIIQRRTLGAAPHIVAIGEIYLDALDKAMKEGISSADAIKMIRDITEYFIDVRGNICYAVTLAMRFITKGLDGYAEQPIALLRAFLQKRVEEYHQMNRSWLDTIRDYGWEVIKSYESILLYDYSSCINAMMETATAHGKTLTVYIPESRSLNGGYHFAKNAKELGQKVIFLPDNAILYGVVNADACFIGAESIYPDGSTCNTVGSDLVAILCDYFKKPFYVATSMIKYDERGLKGYTQPPHWKHLRERLSVGWDKELAERTCFTCPNLSIVKPSLITEYITERGVLPPSAIYMVGTEFMNSI